MQLSVPWRRGQAKPFGSIPRINWSHPLATRLNTYCYDVGGGVLIDLVNGGQRSVTSGFGSVPLLTTPFGAGFNYQRGGSSITMPQIKRGNLCQNAPYSAACGIYPTFSSGGSATIFGIGDSSGSNTITINSNSSTVLQISYGNNLTNTTFTVASNLFNFHTVVGVATALNTTIDYYDGAQINTGTPSTDHTLGATAGPIFNTFQWGGGAANGNQYQGDIFYGACWDRALSAREARLIHDDPYCLLIYPEDEIFASLVGAAIAPALPAAPAERIPWILPGLGPASRHVSLLNAGLPIQPVAPPAAGGTLPFMGVGG